METTSGADMSEQSQDKLEQFIVRVSQRPLPKNAMVRVRTLAKELAEGASEELWGSVPYRFFRDDVFPMNEQVGVYMERRWNGHQPGAFLLISNGYLQQVGESALYGLTKAAFDLVEEIEPSRIFISYKRSESSAFALLVLARLKMAGFEPFLDLALQPGDDWEKGLRERIQKYEYMVALLGPETLKSEVCLKEISWAIEAGLNIIPVWHNGFSYHSGEWDVSLSVDKALSKTHTIRVIEESALGYNNAIVELLNRFGVTP
jgi:TIR domain-containing protein